MAMTPTVHIYYVMVSALQIQISDENSTNMWPAKNNNKNPCIKRVSSSTCLVQQDNIN